MFHAHLSLSPLFVTAGAEMLTAADKPSFTSKCVGACCFLLSAYIAKAGCRCCRFGVCRFVNHCFNPSFVLLTDKKNVIRMVIASQGKTYQSDNNYY